MANDTDVVPVAVSTGSLSFCIYLYIFSFFSIIMQFHKSLMYTDYLNEVNAAWGFWWHSNLACCSLFIFPTSHLYYRHSYWIWPEMKLWTVQNLTELVLLPFVASVCCQYFADFSILGKMFTFSSRQVQILYSIYRFVVSLTESKDNCSFAADQYNKSRTSLTK